MQTLTFYGQQAIDISLASNRQCEVKQQLAGWVTSPNQMTAANFNRINPQSVRLTGSPRALLEDMLHMGVSTDANLLAVCNTALYTQTPGGIIANAINHIKDQLT